MVTFRTNHLLETMKFSEGGVFHYCRLEFHPTLRQENMKNSASLQIAMIVLFTAFSTQASHAAVEVVGGKNVTSQDVISRRTVGIVMKLANGTAICSGEIIDSSHILAAAHCTTKVQGGYIVFATTNIVQVAQQNQAAVRKITSIKAMPGYSGQTGGGGEFADFAIFTFSGGVPMGYEAAHFLPSSVISSKLKVSTSITLAGYGITSAPSAIPAAGLQGAGTLREVAVKLAQIGGQKIDMYLQGQSGHIACEGDSGGPAMVSINGDQYVIGVDSRGNCQDMAIYGIVSKEMVANFVASL
jgi:secreted trypsin-like serine protease